MRTTTSMMRRARLAIVTAGLSAWSIVWAGASPTTAAMQSGGVQPGDGPKQETISADISIARGQTSANGTPQAVATQVSYHWVRIRIAGKWRTTVTLPPAMPWAIDPQTGAARDVGERPVRVEDDEDGTPLRFYNRRDELVRLPSAEELQQVRANFSTLPGENGDRPAPPRPPAVSPQIARPDITPAGQSWADGLIAEPSRLMARREALLRGNGVAKGRVRGLDRYVSYRGDAAIETLVDPAAAVPVEINVVRGTTLVTHTVITYAPGTAGALVRQRINATRLAGSRGERSTVDVQFTNVVRSTGGAR